MLAFTSIADLTALAEKNQRINSELNYYKLKMLELQSSKYSLENIVGSSMAIRELKEEIIKVAQVRQTVLITGESGVGKELIAHSIHNCSERHDRMFVRVNCAAIPENLFESEFSDKAGSFSGASKSGKVGMFELANNGTLFLDEIGELPLFMQSKLLRVLQEKELTRIGGHKTIAIDVRIIAATNRNLEKMIQEEKFREDLYYRINILNIKAPSLREHLEDIPELIPACWTSIKKMV
ncbi:MAG: sigma 54-interacting transcriptional regulator [Frisingicoccus sp.]